jgi:hypothetical protein
MRILAWIAVLCLAVSGSGRPVAASQPAEERFVSWSAQQVEAIGRQMYKKGRVGGFWDTRKLKTERAYNYKLAATWITPDVVRATARQVQLRSRLTDVDTQSLVKEAEAAADTVVIVEIDPREGSGVIPNDWEAFLQPKGRPDAAVRGIINPELRNVKALAGVLRRNYDYDRFWVTFSLTGVDGKPLFSQADQEAEVVVRILDKEGRVDWRIPDSIRRGGTGN